jgi:thiol-disulfide isomerase/thioredoxin
MLRGSLVLVLVLGGIAACSETVYVQQEDAGVTQDATVQEDAPQCGPDTYPCPPYGTVPGTVMENLTFTGWIDDDGDGDPLNDGYRTWGLDYFYSQGLAGDASFLVVNVSAGWCTVCRSETRTLPGVYTDYKDKGVRLAQIIFEDYSSNPATKDMVQEWEEYYKLPFPIGVDPSFKMGRYFDYAATPANILIALRDMTIDGEPVKAMQMLYLMTGYDETELRSYLDNLTTNAQ